MKNYLTAGAALLLTTTAASAGGIDRTLTNYGTLFEPGNYVEMSFAAVRPNVSGDYTTTTKGLDTLGGSDSTGVMSENFNTAAFALKYALTPRIDLGLFVNQPFGANANYPDGFYKGLAAEWDSTGTTVIAKYKATPNISVYGGVRSIESQANILIPNQMIGASTAQQLAAGAQQLAAGAQDAAAGAQAAAAGAAAAAEGGDLVQAAALQAQAQALASQAQDLATQAQSAGAQATAILDTNNATTGPFTYRALTEKDRQTSYVAGVAYERPEIALRVALTYESGYTHSFDTTETLAATGLNLQSSTDIVMPDVYTLDFQSGVAKDTLVFGSIRHATWSDWHVRPAGYEALTGDEVTGIDSDVTTYRLGVGRKINDQFSAFARITYEAGNGDVASRLAPTDGSTAFGFGGTYSRDAFKITGGVEYIKFGEATDASGVVFADNDAVAVGVSVGYRF